MWSFFGVGAIIAATAAYILNGKASRLAQFISLSLTALTVCAFYEDTARRVISEDWGGIMDIVPTVSGYLWACVIASIIINGALFFIKKEEN